MQYSPFKHSKLYFLLLVVLFSSCYINRPLKTSVFYSLELSDSTRIEIATANQKYIRRYQAKEYYTGILKKGIDDQLVKNNVLIPYGENTKKVDYLIRIKNIVLQEKSGPEMASDSSAARVPFDVHYCWINAEIEVVQLKTGEIILTGKEAFVNDQESITNLPTFWDLVFSRPGEYHLSELSPTIFDNLCETESSKIGAIVTKAIREEQKN